MAARVALSRTLPKQSFKQIIRQQPRPHARFNSSQSTPPPPPPPPKRGSYTLPIVGVLALAGAGGYYYYKQSGYTDGTTPGTAFPIVPGKKWVVQSSLGDQVVLIKISRLVLQMVVFLMDPKEVDIFGISFIAWVSMIRKLLPSVVLMLLDDVILIDLDLRGYVPLIIQFN